MSDTNIIKSIVESTCPHCQKQLYIESLFSPAIVGEIFTKEELEKAKQDCIERIDSLSIDENKKEDAIKWINDPNTIFAPGEVESIILSLIKQGE